jgi:hypothetical protein
VMAAGASDYLVKGATLSAILLERSIRHALDRKRSQLHQAKLLADLAIANQELKEFAYIVSHDLKAPLRGISSVAGWLREDYSYCLDDEGKELLQLMARQVRRMDKLIDGVLQYSRIGRVREQKSQINLMLLLDEVIEVIAPPATIQIIVETELPMVWAEITRIQQVFQNLLSNAVKYMDKPSGEIRIGHEEIDDFWQFYVQDTGMGIQERDFDRVFQIFQTLIPRNPLESTGVGLAIVKKIVEIYGGKIWLTSQIGIGSTFYFTLPRSVKGTKD